MPTPLRRTTTRLCATGLVVLLALTGCSRAPSNDATVGNTEVTTEQVETTQDGVAEALQVPVGEISRKAVLATLIQGAVVDEMIARAEAEGRTDLRISAADRAGLIETQPQLQQLSSVPASQPLAEALVDFSLVQQRMGPQEFQEAFVAVPVEVNPRWGEWAPTSEEGLMGTGSLSVESYTE